MNRLEINREYDRGQTVLLRILSSKVYFILITPFNGSLIALLRPATIHTGENRTDKRHKHFIGIIVHVRACSNAYVTAQFAVDWLMNHSTRWQAGCLALKHVGDYIYL